MGPPTDGRRVDHVHGAAVLDGSSPAKEERRDGSHRGNGVRRLVAIVAATGLRSLRIRVSDSGVLRDLEATSPTTSCCSPTSDDGPQATPAGAELLADTSPRGAELLAAFAALHVRVFEADVGTPADACGATRGKAEQQAKCGFIGVIGCIPPAAAFTCGVSAAIAVGGAWLVEKVCETEPETCEPGWTEG